MKIAVIGSTGQLGTDLIKTLENGHEVIGLAHKDIEITDHESCLILKEHRPDVIINTAAFHKTDQCEEEPLKTFNVNAIGARNVAMVSREMGATSVFISTDYVFDGSKNEPYTEDDTPSPINTYGISKIAGEQYTRQNPKHYIIRIASVFGAAGASGKGGNFVETMITKAKKGESITVVDDMWMSPTYTKDAALTLKRIIESKLPYGTYHATNSGYCSWYQFAEGIFQITGLNPDLTPIKTGQLSMKAKRPRKRSLHIAQIGIGRVGRPTAYTIMCAELAETITVCDTKPGLAMAFAEELRHVTASLKIDVEIIGCERDEDVAGADIILVSAGKPRTPGVKMSRRDLAVQNGEIVKYIAETTAPNNPAAKYIVITNPVDAMAMVCKKYSRAKFVISTGTNLESLRFRSGLAKALEVPASAVEGWVGGEHGKGAVILWSTTKVSGLPLNKYVRLNDKTLIKDEIDLYVKSVSKVIIDNIGGTEYGPAASFRDIVRAVVRDTNEVFPVAAPIKFEELPEPVFVSVPLQLGNSIGSSIYNNLSAEEKREIIDAAKAIYQTYETANKTIELT